MSEYEVKIQELQKEVKGLRERVDDLEESKKNLKQENLILEDSNELVRIAYRDALERQKQAEKTTADIQNRLEMNIREFESFKSKIGMKEYELISENQKLQKKFISKHSQNKRIQKTLQILRAKYDEAKDQTYFAKQEVRFLKKALNTKEKVDFLSEHFKLRTQVESLNAINDLVNQNRKIKERKATRLNEKKGKDADDIQTGQNNHRPLPGTRKCLRAPKFDRTN